MRNFLRRPTRSAGNRAQPNKGIFWQGHTAMRISVSSWATTDNDVERSLEAVLRIARKYAGR
jgi:hypothetical protein